MSKSHATGCLLCGGEIRYDSTASEMSCALCGRKDSSTAQCEQGHFVCDTCHRGNAFDVIEAASIASEGVDPIELAQTLMQSPTVKMHGPEHHFLVPAVMLSTVCNAIGTPDAKPQAIREARRRAEKVPGGFCGSHGNCGAAVGTGVFASVLLTATPLSTDAWKKANGLTARTLLKIAEHGGPRCCKRDSFVALQEAAKFARSELSAKLEVPARIRCAFHERNKECHKAQCPFFPRA